MKKYEYNALLKAVDDLKEADAAFSHSYVNGRISEEQVDLYEKLKYQLDELYIMADMVLSGYKNKRMLREQRRRVGR